MKRCLVMIACCFFMVMSSFSAAHAASYPQRPIQFLIGWAVGGGSDQAGRALAMGAESHLGRPLAVQNIPAGAGAQAYAQIANARPDGYTIGLTTSTISTLKPMGTIPYGSEEFEHIITFNTDPGGIWVNVDAPWKTLGELIEHAKKNPDQVSVAASTPGSITRFQLIALEQNSDVTFRIISQQGGAANGLLQLAGGHLDVAMGTPLEGYALYQAGRIRPLGFYSDTRVPMMSDIPTLLEQGFPIAMATTRTVIAPKNTPKEIIDILYDAFSKVVSDEKFIADMESKGSTVLNLNPEETKEYLKLQDAAFLEIIKNAGLYKPAS